MAEFEREFSSFPEKKITRHYFKNVDDNIAPVINQINELHLKGLYNQAALIIQQNFSALSHYIIDAITFRTWEEEIYNTQIYVKKQQQSIYFEESEEDVDCIEGDVWLGGD